MRALAVLAAVLGIVATPVISQTVRKADAFFGTWALTRSQSHYADGSIPEQMTLFIEPAPDGLAYRSETRFVGGRISSSRFVARLDDTPALVVGTSGFLAPVSLLPSANGGINATYTSGVKKLAWSQWSVNAAGSELVIRTTFLSANGEPHENLAAFRRSDTH